MMEIKSIRIRAEGLNKLIAARSEDYEKLIDQITRTNNDADRNRLNREAESILEEIENRERELKKLNLSGGNYRQSSSHWEDNLYRINFSSVKTQLRNICQQIEDQEGAALFLLKNSQAMGGKWSLKLIEQSLQALGTWYPPLEFGFLQHQIANPADFLSAVAKRFDAQISENSETQTVTELIRKIYGALPAGHVFLIQIEIPYLDAKSTFLNWFIRQFWCPLVRELPVVSTISPQVKVFAVLKVRGTVDDACLQENLCCPQEQFDCERALELLLQPWTEVEIRNWLVQHSGLMSLAIGLTRPEVERIARTIYQVSQGRPIDVYHELMNTMSSKVS
jgi:hypothetical protein